MAKLRAIGFDLDDTLYPEREYALGGFRAVSAWAGEALRVEVRVGR
jgi:putative hydrolase of the HAD superfamily